MEDVGQLAGRGNRGTGGDLGRRLERWLDELRLLGRRRGLSVVDVESDMGAAVPESAWLGALLSGCCFPCAY